MSWLRTLTWNDEQQRVRALWRLLLHGAAIAILGFAGLNLLASLGVGLRGLSATWALGAAAIFSFATWIATQGLDRRPFEDLGLRLSPRWWADLGAGFAIGAILMAAIFVIELELGWLELVGRNAGASAGRSFWFALLDPWITFVAVAFYEELVSRGYHLRNIAEGLAELSPRLGPRAVLILATLLSATIFGLSHSGNANASTISTVYIGLAGCMLALGVLWTGELGLAIGLHLSWNFFQGNVFGFPVSGNPMDPRIFDVIQRGDPLITGGAFGPEAGLIGVAAMAVGAGLIAVWVRLSRGELSLQHSLLRPSLERPRV